GLDAVVTEGDLGSTLGLALRATALLLAVLDLPGHQHGQSPSPGRKRGVTLCCRVERSISFSSARWRSSSGSASFTRGAASTSSVGSARASAGASAGRRRAAAEDTTLRGLGAPEVSPAAMAASRVILSSRVLL